MTPPERFSGRGEGETDATQGAPGGDSFLRQWRGPAAHDDAIKSHGVYRFGLAYGRLVHKLRWFILAIWVIALAASVPFAAQLTSVLTGGGYNLNQSESVAVGNLIQQKFNLPQSSVLVVFQSADTPVSDPAYQSEVSGFMDRARASGT